MTSAYFNYPNPHIELHGDVACAQVGKMKKMSQREFAVDLRNLNDIVSQLSSGSFRFAAEASLNDLRLNLDLGVQSIRSSAGTSGTLFDSRRFASSTRST